MKIIRVFIEKTNCTPIDDNVRINSEPGLFDACDEVHISVVFTWHLKRAEYLKKTWQHIAPVYVGGPATGEKSGDFEPGKYIKNGYTITSRGCPNKCWFCSVWKREGNIRELKVFDGNNLLDDNILACSDEHVLNVFDMLKKNKPCQITGGLEAARLKESHVIKLKEVNPAQVFFAYDTPDDYDPLVEAGKLLKKYGFKFRQLRCHVLMGYKGDTFEKAENRICQTINAGFMPSAMVYRVDKDINKDWARFQRQWQRPASIIHIAKQKGLVI